MTVTCLLRLSKFRPFQMTENDIDLNLLPQNLKACKNCGLESDNRHCPKCGQSMDINISSILFFINDTLSIIYSLDSKVWQSIFPLLFKPRKAYNRIYCRSKSALLASVQAVFNLQYSFFSGSSYSRLYRIRKP